MIKISKIQGGFYFCEGKDFNLLAFNLLDLLSQLKSIYNITLPELFTFDNLN